MITVRTFSQALGLREGVPLAELPALLAEPSETVWVDIGGKNGTAAETLLRDTFQLHPMVVEDCLSPRRHPKVEEYDTYLYAITHGVVPHATAREFGTRELDTVLGERWLVTHHAQESRSVNSALEHVRRHPAATIGKGPDFLLHAILDEQVDQWMSVLDLFDERIAQLEDRIFTDSGKAVLDEIFDVRKSVMRLRRVSTHQREVLLRMSRREFPQIRPATAPYLRDVYDHLVRITDLAELYRELISGVLEAYLSVQSNRLNDIMRILTVFATIFIPITFITSLYGMNFEYMPELHWKWSYPVLLAIMLVIAVGSLIAFRRRRFL
jgi:magnesium transporter